MKKQIPLNTNNIDGREYWRSLGQLEQSEEYKQFLHREFPEGASEFGNDWSRRNFLTLMGASIALAGIAGCRRPVDKIVPYVRRPEEIVPGDPIHFATTMPFGTSSYGVLVKSNEGRPTFVGGNSLHPSSKGAANIYIQADILNMYDPDRARREMHNGVESTWDQFVADWQGRFEQHRANKGNGLAVLCEQYASPTMARLRRDFEKQFPRAEWYTYEPISDESVFDGVRIATGSARRPVYRTDAAKVILSLDSDFLRTESENINNARGFANGRRVLTQKDDMNRLYSVEGYFSVTGTNADHRLQVKSSQIGVFALALAAELSNRGVNLPFVEGLSTDGEFDKAFLSALAKDLVAAKGKSLVVAGTRQPAEVHAIVYLINEALGNNDSTVQYYDLKDTSVSSTNDLVTLSRDLNAGSVDTLFLINANPAYVAPADFDFKALMKKAKHVVSLSSYADESSEGVEWFLPMAHYLESWGDARSADGTLSTIQPLIAPLYDGHSPVELLALMSTGRDLRGYDIVRETWRDIIRGDYEKGWRKALHDGVLEDSAVTPAKTRGNATSVAEAVKRSRVGARGTSDDLELVFYTGNVYDGRYANNGWLQELPDPVSKVAWDNPALISPETAKRLNLNDGDMVRIEAGGQSLDMAVFITPGTADNVFALALGYGRKLGRVAKDVGFDTYKLRGSAGSGFIFGAKVSRLGNSYELANTQHHGSMEGRPILREATLAEYQNKAEFFPEQPEHPPLIPLWNPRTYNEGYQWGMSIDLNACIGCGACTVACQAENNIPIVGKKQVRNGREMQWMRLDRYFAGEPAQPLVAHQPMPCQQCENAPCEEVCPVGATMHDEEGLNVMVYNRCIGTRYCSNNCPYKVRHFNFFNYTKDKPETEKMLMNPDVTVRSRGVMEKCTYCIQRISRTKINAKNEGREVKDGEIVTACQQVCPADAIVFGNVNDPNSRVSKLKNLNRDYSVLVELNTKPRTTYLAKLRNPNPELEGKKNG